MDLIQLLLVNLHLVDVLLLVNIAHMKISQQPLARELQRAKTHSLVTIFLAQILRRLLLMLKEN